jgi:DNA (cytosine-5)-methyltransferase 1
MNVVDLFCGCGGFSLGARQAGISTALAIDNDPILSFPYLTNFPRSRLLLADLSRLEASYIRRCVGDVDGVFGGPPCQGFSDIGLRKATDPRRDLLLDFFRLVAELKPAFFVMENVPGLGYVGAKHLLDRALNLVVKRYKILGPTILDAADFGAATKRPRMFVLGLDPTRSDPITLCDIQRRHKAPATVQAAIADLQDAVFVRHENEYDVWRITGRGRPSVYARSLRSKSGEFTGHSSTEHTRAVVKRFAKINPGEVDKVGRHPRLAWDGQCATLRAGTGSERGSYQSVRPIHPDEARVITVREAARLQGFPDEFRFHPTIWHSFRMIGNSVSPIISRAIFSTIANRIDIKKSHLAAAE